MWHHLGAKNYKERSILSFFLRTRKKKRILIYVAVFKGVRSSTYQKFTLCDRVPLLWKQLKKISNLDTKNDNSWLLVRILKSLHRKISKLTAGKPNIWKTKYLENMSWYKIMIEKLIHLRQISWCGCTKSYRGLV